MLRGSFVLVLLLALLPISSFAQSQWELGGQIRYRGEYDALGFDRSVDASTFSTLRTRVGLTFRPVESTSVFVELQDSRTFGEESSTTDDGTADAFDAHQAYFRLLDLAGLPLDVTVGRTEVAYGTERFVGVAGWGAYGRSFDGVSLRLHGEEAWVDVFGFREVERFNPGNRGDRNFYGFWGQTPLGRHGAFHSFLLWQRTTPSDLLDRYTFGVYLPLKFGVFQPVIEGAWQTGQEAGTDISAYTASARVAFVNDGTLFRSLSAGADIVSGNRRDDPDRIRAFSSVYGTGHRYFGFMDYFTSFPADALGLGLTDFHATLVVEAGTSLSVEAAFHHFVSGESYRLPGGGESRLFGDELDLTAEVQYNERVTITGGASVFVPGDIFKARRGDDLATWLYLMTTVRF